MYFALRDELHAYLEHVADKFNLRPHIRFETEVKSANYNQETQQWEVSVQRADGAHETLRSNVLISAVGIFNPIKLPNIKGLESFAGPCFHTAEWPADVDLTGKRVVMIGNGASAMQTGPEIQNIVKSLTIFQRSPHWVAPNEQFRKPIPDALRFLLREVPLYRAWYRIRLGWTFGDRVHATLQKDPNWQYADRSLNKINDSHRAYFTQYIVSEIGDKTELLEQVLPTYPPFGKRMLMDNGWYRMLRNEKVKLVSDPIVEIGPDGAAHNIQVIRGIGLGLDENPGLDIGIGKKPKPLSKRELARMEKSPTRPTNIKSPISGSGGKWLLSVEGLHHAAFRLFWNLAQDKAQMDAAELRFAAGKLVWRKF